MAQSIEMHPVILVVDDDLHPSKVSQQVESTNLIPRPAPIRPPPHMLDPHLSIQPNNTNNQNTQAVEQVGGRRVRALLAELKDDYGFRILEAVSYADGLANVLSVGWCRCLIERGFWGVRV